MAETLDRDPLSLLGESARRELERRAGESGLSPAALAAQLLARVLTGTNGREIAQTRAEGEDLARSLLPRLIHELRTPVGSLLMLSEMLDAEAGGDPARAAHNVHRVRMLVSDIQTLLEEVAELSALQRGAVLPRPGEVRVATLVAELVRLHRALAAEHSVTFELQIEPSAPAVVRTDRSRLDRALQILLRNAIRAGANGRVALRVSLDGEPPEGRIVFAVVDRGAPLPPAGERSVFQPFALADARTRRAHGGGSLALPIAAATATVLGGTVSAESSADATTFRLTLPA